MTEKVRSFRTKAALAVAILAPAPTVGVLLPLLIEPGPIGTTAWALAKVWLFATPLLWLWLVDRKRVSWSPLRVPHGVRAGMTTGLVIVAVIVLAGAVATPFVDFATLREKAAATGLGNIWIYLAGCAYWICINSVLEEYVYRWFLYEKVNEALGKPGIEPTEVDTAGESWLPLLPLIRDGWRDAGIWGSTVIFTIHHVVAVWLFMGPVIGLLAGLGVFIGGWLWCAMVKRYRSVWPGWISHAWADVGVFLVGGWWLFG